MAFSIKIKSLSVDLTVYREQDIYFGGLCCGELLILVVMVKTNGEQPISFFSNFPKAAQRAMKNNIILVF